MSDADPRHQRFNLRLSKAVFDRLAKAADDAGRSMNAEIALRLEASFSQKSFAGIVAETGVSAQIREFASALQIAADKAEATGSEVNFDVSINIQPRKEDLFEVKEASIDVEVDPYPSRKSLRRRRYIPES